MELIKVAEEVASKTWRYFSEYFESNYAEQMDFNTFKSLPFEFQLGVYISFFNSVSTDVDVYSTEPEALKDAVLEAFKQYEEYLFLDS